MINLSCLLRVFELNETVNSKVVHGLILLDFEIPFHGEMKLTGDF